MKHDDLSDYCVNLEVLATADKVEPSIRKLAATLLKQQYMTVGQWLESLSDSEIDEVRAFAYTDSPRYNAEQMILLTLVLATGEGCPVENVSDLRKATGLTQLFVAAAVLGRRDELIVFYQNMSYGDDAGDALIVQRKA